MCSWIEWMFRWRIEKFWLGSNLALTKSSQLKYEQESGWSKSGPSKLISSSSLSSDIIRVLAWVMILLSLSIIACWLGDGVSLMLEPFLDSITSNLANDVYSLELRLLKGIFSKHFWQQNGSSIFFSWILYSLRVMSLHLIWLQWLQYGHNNALWSSSTIREHTLHGP